MSERSLRLRLCIRRNGLPETRIVYPLVADEETTVYKLLERVNEIIPLEGTDWGLDDYVVELKSSSNGAAFECLHFQPVAHLLEKDDEVLIRPLISEELKKRRLSGRHQISSDGKHLLDGVPFGRPLLKRPANRPPVHILPRKRPRVGEIEEAPGLDTEDEARQVFSQLDQATDGELSRYERMQVIRYASGSAGDNAENDDDDADFEVDGDDPASESDALDDEDDDPDLALDEDELQLLREDQHQHQKHVRFTKTNAIRDASPAPAKPQRRAEAAPRQPNNESADNGGESDASSDTSSDGTSDSDWSSGSDSDGNDEASAGDRSSDDESYDGRTSSGSSDSGDDSDSSNSSDSSTGNSDNKNVKAQANVMDECSGSGSDDEPPDVQSIGSKAEITTARVRGRTSCTEPSSLNNKTRGELGEKLAELGQLGVLSLPTPDTSEPADAATKDAQPRPAAPSKGKLRTQKRNARRRAKRAIERAKTQAEAAGGNEASEPTNKKAATTMPEAAEPLSESPAPTPPSSQQPDQRRLKLDLGASRRMLFSALGFRTARAGQSSNGKSPHKAAQPAPAVNKAEDAPTAEQTSKNNEPPQKTLVEEGHPDHWRNHIVYRAVECSGEDVVLTEPPFPFVQRWDATQQFQANGGSRKRKKRQDASHPSENARPNKKARGSLGWCEELESELDYDGHGVGSSNGAAKTARIGEEEEEEEEKDLPPLPSNLASLPPLSSASDAAVGTVITWKKWALSKKTGWQPQIVDVTGVVVGVHDGDDDAASTTLRVRLARRDRAFDKAEKSYDEETGERVYDRFEAPDSEEENEEEEEGDGTASEAEIETVAFADLLEPRIVQPASPDK
ncbi:ef-hand 2 [Niveomyces insectorum RCEF 264]|uniref:Ef-hand 2 n=1 Tax=Niveomyces insectorum RCEF 264 TaxID=1081102 RepID=A0A162KC03_9HYPO|nr:ef-hand 2 [Niveomyces insectorum RCEF 264]